MRRRNSPAPPPLYRKVTIRVVDEPDALQRVKLLTDGLLRVLGGSGARLVQTLKSDPENGCLELVVEGHAGVPLIELGVVTVKVELWTRPLRIAS